MSGFSTTLDVLLASHNRDAPRVLGYLLTRGDMRLRRRAVERMLASTDGRAQVHLVRHFGHLGDPLARLVLGRVDALGPGLRAAMATRDPRLQHTVVRIAESAGDLSLAYLVGEAAASTDEAVRGEAVALLLRWAAGVRREEMSLAGEADVLLDSGLARRRQFVLDGLQRAFSVRYASEMPRVLRAAAMVADRRVGWFWSAMGMSRDRRRVVLLRDLAARLEPELFGFTVQALGRDGIGGEAADLLNRPFGREELDALLREFDRQGELPSGALRRLAEVPWLGAGEAALETLPTERVATALALAVGSSMPRTRLAVVCRGIAVNHAEAEARRLALDALAHCGDAGAAELRVVACTGPSPSAGMALVLLARRGAAALESERGETAARAVDNLLRDWTHLSADERREVGRSLTVTLRKQPELIRHHLIVGSRTRHVAVALVRAAQVADVFASELRVLASTPADTQAQSAALSALAEGAAEGVRQVLDEALNSWDARVRANALEALDHREASDEVFLPFTDDASPRVRANAALALIERRRPEGQAALRRMLTGSEAERLSGLWVLSQTRSQSLERTAELLASADPSARVRRRADELLADAG